MSETFKNLMVSHGDAIESLIENDGEITPEQEQLFATLMQKVDGLESFRCALDSEETRFDHMIKLLTQAKRRVVDRKNWVDQYVITNLQANGETEISGEMIRLVLQNNPPRVEITDERETPQRFWKTVTEMTLDKTAIGVELRAGNDVPGARLVRGVRLVAKANSILTKPKKVTA